MNATEIQDRAARIAADVIDATPDRMGARIQAGITGITDPDDIVEVITCVAVTIAHVTHEAAKHSVLLKHALATHAATLRNGTQR